MGCWRERVFAVCAVIVTCFVSSVSGFAGEYIFYDGSDTSLLQEVPSAANLYVPRISLAPSGSESGKSNSLVGNIVTLADIITDEAELKTVYGAINDQDFDSITGNSVILENVVLGKVENEQGDVWANGIVYGGYSNTTLLQNDSGIVTQSVSNNSIRMKNSEAGYVYGAHLSALGSSEGALLTANNNYIELDGGEAGYFESANVSTGNGPNDTATANNNQAVVKNAIASDVGGGAAYAGFSSGTAIGNNNRVRIENSKISYAITGGTAGSATATASGNIVTIIGGEIGDPSSAEHFSSIEGGVALGNIATVENNRVFIDDGVIAADVQGGSIISGGGDEIPVVITKTLAIGNVVNINNGIVTGNIFGGKIDGDFHGSHTVTNNTVTINGGEVNNSEYPNYTVSGGTIGIFKQFWNDDLDGPEEAYKTASSTNNTVVINNGKVTGGIYGGQIHYYNHPYDNDNNPYDSIPITTVRNTATHNTVTITGASDLSEASVYGGVLSIGSGHCDIVTESEFLASSDIFTGNTLNKNSDASIRDAHNFEFVNFGYNGDANIGALDTTGGDVKLNTGGYFTNFNDQINGSGSLTKIGSGTLNFGGSMDIEGKFTVREGDLALSKSVSVTADDGLVFGAGSRFTPNGNTLTANSDEEVTLDKGSSLNLKSIDVGNVILIGANGIQNYSDSLFYETQIQESGTKLRVVGRNSVNDIIRDMRDAGVTVGQNGSNGLGVIHNIVNKADDELRERLYGDLHKVIEMANGGDTDGASIALEQILGQYSTRGMKANQTVAQTFSGSIFGHLAQMRDSRVAMGAAQSNGAFASLNGGSLSNRIWAGGFGTFTRQDDADGEHGYDYNAGGFILGYDRQFGQNITAGFTGAYSRGRVKGNEGYSETDIDTLNLGLYASYDPQCGFYAEANLGFGYTWNKEYEELLVGGNRSGKYETYSLQAGGNVGYAFQLPSAFRIIPTVGLQYIRVHQNEHAQTGSGLLMWRDSTNADYVEIPFAVRINKTFDFANGLSLTPELRTAWIYEAKKDAASIRVGYVGSSDSFMLTGTNPGSHRGLVGAGMKVRFNQTIDAFINYNLEFRGNYQSHSIMAGLGLSF